MKKTENKTTKSGGFEPGLLQLTVLQSKEVIVELKKIFPVHSTFYCKRNGKNPFTPSEEIVVRQIFARYGIDAFTGQKIES
jgi:hypothetical protein